MASSQPASEGILQALFDSATEGLVVVDAQGIIQLANRRMEEMFGYLESELVGHPVELLVPIRHATQHVKDREAFSKKPEQRSMGARMDLSGLRKDGSEFPVEISLNHYSTDGNLFVMALVSDVTKRKQSQQKKAESDSLTALEKARQLNELKSRFLTMASHEFRTPLSTILTSLSLAQKYVGPEHLESREKHYGRIKSAVHHLTGILEDFLSLDKLERGHIMPTLGRVDFKALIEDAIDELRPICKEGQHINFRFEGEIEVVTDQNMLRIIVANLVSNAIKYSPENSMIQIDAWVRDQKIRIDVRDQGIGIPEADKPHMFERFFRAKNAVNIGGTGLGLNIVSAYVDLLGGDVWFESEAEQGSLFSVVLPQNLVS